MEFADLLDEFGRATGLEQLALDADGQCALLFDGAHEITFTPDRDDHALIMHCEVGTFSGHDTELCRTLLEASLLGSQTGGGALSVEPKLGVIILWKRHDDAFADVNALTQAVNAFLAQVIYWKQRLARPQGGGNAGTTEPADSAMPAFGLFV